MTEVEQVFLQELSKECKYVESAWKVKLFILYHILASNNIC